MKDRVEIEAEFDKLIRSMGAVVLRETLSKSPPFDNADYHFPAQQVVAELKCLKENKLDDPAFANKVDACWRKWRERGLVTGETPELMRSDSIPRECFGDIRRIYSATLRDRIKKANKQIRETKAHLDLSDHQGLLLLANDADLAIPPDSLFRLVLEILHGSCSEIDEVVLFTANLLSKVPTTDVPCYLWLIGTVPGRQAINPRFSQELGVRWKACHEQLMGRKCKSFGGFIPQRIYI